MNFKCWDVLEESLAEQVLERGMAARVAVVETCRAYPKYSVRYLSLALASMAAVLEVEWVSGPLPQQTRLLEVYRTTVALSADIAVVELAASTDVQCRDLLRHWADTGDRFFVVG